MRVLILSSHELLGPEWPFLSVVQGSMSTSPTVFLVLGNDAVLRGFTPFLVPGTMLMLWSELANQDLTLPSWILSLFTF